MSVYDLPKNASAEIVAVNVSGASLIRLNSLNIVKGRRIASLGFSLFKSSVLILCGAVRLGMRKSFAKKIEVRLLEGYES